MVQLLLQLMKTYFTPYYNSQDIDGVLQLFNMMNATTHQLDNSDI